MRGNVRLTKISFAAKQIQIYLKKLFEQNRYYLYLKNKRLVSKIKIIVLFSICFILCGCVPDKYEFVNEIGKGGSGPSEFRNPTDLDIMPDGNLVICDSGNHRIQIISPTDGRCLTSFGEFGTTSFKVQGMSGIGVNKVNSDIWVCDLKGNKIIKFDKQGNPLIKITDKDNMKYPQDVCADRKGDIYVVMNKQPYVYKFDGVSGNFICTLGGKGKTALVFPLSIVYANECLYVADYGSKRVLKLTTSGELVTEYTKKGEYEELLGPSSLFVDKNGDIVLLDLGEIPIVLLKSDGTLISKVGSFGEQKGRFLYPRGIVKAENNDIYVLDNTKNIILSFKMVAKK